MLKSIFPKPQVMDYDEIDGKELKIIVTKRGNLTMVSGYEKESDKIYVLHIDGLEK